MDYMELCLIKHLFDRLTYVEVSKSFKTTGPWPNEIFIIRAIVINEVFEELIV